MFSNNQLIRQIVQNAVEAVNEELNEADRISPAGETALAGFDSALTSLHVINLVLRVEEEITIRFNVDLCLTDDDFFFDPEGPLRSIDEFVIYLSRALSVDSRTN